MMLKRGGFRFGLGRGVPLEPQNSYPSLRGILAEMCTHCYRFFLKNAPIFYKFSIFWHAKTQKFEFSQEIGLMFKDFICLFLFVYFFFVKKGIHY